MSTHAVVTIGNQTFAGIGFGVMWYVWGIYGLGWGLVYGLFWPVILGYKLAHYLF